MAPPQKPVVFIGSSVEGLPIAEAVQQELERAARPLLWSQGVFRPTRSTLESLVGLLPKVDFAVLVLTPDDTRVQRGRRVRVARGNVLFELGLLIGAVGRDRTFFLVPRDTPHEIISDLAGIEPVWYSPDSSIGGRAAVGAACTSIRALISEATNLPKSDDLLDPDSWTQRYPSPSPIERVFLRTSRASQEDLLARIEKAETAITIFGLTRNFFATREAKRLLLDRSRTLPVRLYLMDPDAESRRDRYRIEPLEAALEDPKRLVREVLTPFKDLLREAGRRGRGRGKLEVLLYDFPCSFAIEQIDSSCRVMLYGHGKRGTDGPIFVFREGTPYYQYFISQLRWLDELSRTPTSPWLEKGIHVVPLAARLTD